jgi:hypothetical protein
VNAQSRLMSRPGRQVAERTGERTGARVSGRVVVLAGRIEAARLCRSPLVLAGLVVAAWLIWWNSRPVVPQWWVWDVQIDSTLLVVAGAVLVAAQLAVGRVRRDDAVRLYASYPTSASARTSAHLLGLAGPLSLAAALVGAAVIWLDLLGPVGTPRPAVLAQGLLMVALAGAIGVALGSWLPHPMTGILAVIVIGAAEADLLVPFGEPVQLPGGTAWLFPWTQPVVLRWLPGPTSAIPPNAHLAWLAALTGLAIIAALGRFASRPRLTGLTGLTALSAAGCLAVAGWSGWAQTRPVPLSVQEALVHQTTRPARAEQCISQPRVHYCAYPGFRADAARWAIVVNGVLDRLPSHPARALVVRQVVDVEWDTPQLYVGYEPATTLLRLDAELGRFVSAQGFDPSLVPGSSVPPVYVDLNWGAGTDLGPYQLGLAMQVARWVTGLPTTWQRIVSYRSGPRSTTEAQISCLPVGQAREAIALWLAASATLATRAPFLAGLEDITPSKVGGTWISSYAGALVSGYQPALNFTGQGAVLAQAMLSLPERRVEAVLAGRWPGWLKPQATDAQLAAALGIPLPSAPPPPMSMANPGQPSDPVCR